MATDVFDWLKRFMGMTSPHAHLLARARMSEDDACIAAEAETGQAMMLIDLVDTGDDFVWSLRSATKGSWTVVTLRDSNGTVLTSERQGVR